MADTDDSRERKHARTAARWRAWRKANPERVAFLDHRAGAKKRHIAFLLTFEEWWMIWQASGRWAQRGHCRGQYVMARTGDTGPYHRDNVRISTVRENQDDAAANLTIETRRKISDANRARRPTKETRRKMAESHTGRHPTEETRQKLSEASKAMWARRRQGG